MAANWSELNHDLLVEIAKRIKLVDDFIAFGGVCKSWRSAADLKNYMFKYNHMPQLLLAPSKESSCQREFYNISKGVSRQVCLPEANDKKILSSKGWLLTIDRNWDISLLHPYKSVQIELPNIRSFEDWNNGISHNIMRAFFIEKFVLSTSPLEEEDYTVMVIYGRTRKLAYFKPRYKAWITLRPTCSKVTMFSDIFYYNKKFYVVDLYGRIMVCDFSGENRNPSVVAEMPSIDLYGGIIPNELVRGDVLEELYLTVVSDEVLWVISRRGVYRRPIEPGSDVYIYGTYDFQVFEVKLLSSSSSSSWTEIKDLENKSIFVGHNSTFFKASHISGCKPNCIYFADDFIESYFFRSIEGENPEGGGRDMGIYNIEDGSIIPHFKGKSVDFLSPPMWVELGFD
ncbi:F-box protein [Melia azedarach]|uniref:F-box protein n=1 Tax=Melia azedarach TaxID=155640 RepID=A0ACC1XQ67_MELAZ|nr:F-box protein [Melia azedarach]